MMFNQGGGFFTPKNFQFQQHFTPKTLIAQSTTTNESCSLMQDSDVRSVTYVLKSSKESTLRQETNSTQGDKNIRMIEYEEFEKSNSSSVQSNQDNYLHHHYIVDVNNGGHGKLIAEGTLSLADSEERNVITPQNQQQLQFDFKQKQHPFLPSSQQSADSNQFTEEQHNNLKLNDYWIHQVKLDNDLQNELTIQGTNPSDRIQENEDANTDINNKLDLFQNENDVENLNQQKEQNHLFEEYPTSSERIRRSNHLKEQQNVNSQLVGQKSKILVQDQICQESIIYEEEDSENSKSTDRQYYKLNRSISNQLSGQLCTLPINQSSARSESLQKTRSNKQQQNTSKNNVQSNQIVQAFTIEEEVESSNKQQLQIQIQSNSIDYPIAEEQQNMSSSNISIDNNKEQLKINNQFFQNCLQLQQKQNQQIQPSIKEQRSSFFASNKSHLCINDIDTNFQDEGFSGKPYQSFQQNNEIQYEFFGGNKRDSFKDLQVTQQNTQQIEQLNIYLESKQLNENQLDQINQNANQVIAQDQFIPSNLAQIEEKINVIKEPDCDRLFYPNSSKFHLSSLDQCLNGQQDFDNQLNINNDPSQRLNFDQCESSSNSAREHDGRQNDSIMLKQNYQNIISNYKQRNSSLPQLNSHNTSRNSNYNTNSNAQNIEGNYASNNFNNNKNLYVNPQSKISQIITKQENQEDILDDSHQKRFRNGQYSAILKKLEETLDMNSESDFYLIKKLQLSHGVSLQQSEHDNSNTLINQNQYKKINPTTNQSYILEETGEDFIFNSKEIERLEQVDNSFLLNNKENIGGQNSSLNLDSKVLLADTIYSSCNTSHIFFINIQSSDKRALKSQKKEGKSNQTYLQDNFQPSYLPHTNQQGNKFLKNQQSDNSKYQQQITQASYNPHITQLDQGNNKNQTQQQLSQSHQKGLKQKNQQPILVPNRQIHEILCNQDINYIKEIEYLKREVIKLNQDLKNLDVQNWKNQEIIDQQQANILRLEERLIHYKDELKSKLQQLDTKDIQINKLFEEKEELKNKKKKLKEQIKQKDQLITQQQQQRLTQVTNSEAVHKLQKELDQKNEILNEQSEQFGDIQKKFSESNHLLKVKFQEIKQLSDENQFLREQIDHHYNLPYQQQNPTSSNDYSNQPNRNTINSTLYNKNTQGQTGSINLTSNCLKNDFNNENLQQVNASINSSISTHSIQSGKQSKEVQKSCPQNLNEQRLRSYSQNDSSINSQYNVYRAPLFNQNQMTTSQPYNLTEESQYLVQSTQVDIQNIQNSQDNVTKCNSSQQRGQSSTTHPHYNNREQFVNKASYNNDPIQEKLTYQQLRYSYDNYKNYKQNNQQKPTNSKIPQPVTLNSAIAQYKIQALEERKLTELNNSGSSNNILVNHSYNPSEVSYQQSQRIKQIENINSQISGGFNSNESMSQNGNKSQISTSCNSKHYESHVSNSQMGSNNTSQKSLNYQNSIKQQYSLQNNNTLRGEQQQQIQQPIQSNGRAIMSESQNIQSRILSNEQQLRHRATTNYSMESQNDFQQQQQQKTSFNRIGEIFSNEIENDQQNLKITHNDKYLSKLKEYKEKLTNQQHPSLNNFNQNSIIINNQSNERVSTSPNRKKKNEKLNSNDVSEYNSVPSYSNNHFANENRSLQDQPNHLNGANPKKIGQNSIDLASINNKINSNYQLIESLSLNNNRQDQFSSQYQNNPLQNNYMNSSQNLNNNQIKAKREHSYSLHQPTSSQINYCGVNSNQLIHSYNNNCIDPCNKTTIFKKPPRSSNEIRQSLQGSSQQYTVSQQGNLSVSNDSLNLNNLENKYQQKLQLHPNNNVSQNFNQQDQRTRSQEFNNKILKQTSKSLQSQQLSQEYPQRQDKFQKWNNQMI